jgi:hypothetical protein
MGVVTAFTGRCRAGPAAQVSESSHARSDRGLWAPWTSPKHCGRQAGPRFADRWRAEGAGWCSESIDAWLCMLEVMWVGSLQCANRFGWDG